MFAAAGVGCAPVLLGILVISSFAGIKTARPLGQLSAVAAQMEQGNFGIRSGHWEEIPLHENNEIGMLAHALNTTISRLRGYVGEIDMVLAGHRR